MFDLSEIKKDFKDQKILKLALTHKSYLNEHPEISRSNERLEFLGDAILEYLISKEIYTKFPDQEEGFLTALRSNLVNTVNLAQVAKKLGLGKVLLLSKGEEETGGRDNQNLLANTVEALIGAIYLDGGLEKAYDFVNETLIVNISDKLNGPLKDPKSRLQETVQAKGFTAPLYTVIDEEGPDHAKKFTLEVYVDGKAIGRGSGKNKSEAAQKAAEAAIKSLSL